MVSRPVPTWNLMHELYNSIYSGERGVRMKVIEMGLHWDRERTIGPCKSRRMKFK